MLNSRRSQSFRLGRSESGVETRGAGGEETRHLLENQVNTGAHNGHGTWVVYSALSDQI